MMDTNDIRTRLKKKIKRNNIIAITTDRKNMNDISSDSRNIIYECLIEIAIRL